jgi:hypothetical protein
MESENSKDELAIISRFLADSFVEFSDQGNADTCRELGRFVLALPPEVLAKFRSHVETRPAREQSLLRWAHSFTRGYPNASDSDARP